MPRLFLFVEGQTEETFANIVLKPHLVDFQVYLQKAILIAHARRHGKVHRGGVIRYAPIKDDVSRFLKHQKADDVFFSTMIDLYALPKDFPGFSAAEPLRNRPRDRVDSLETAFAKDVADERSRFIPYIQLHEFEALLFADISKFETVYEGRRKEIEELRSIADGHESPELIDDGVLTAPSKRIIDRIPRYENDKVAVGPTLAQKIGLDVIRSKCPHFHQWVERLERLGQSHRAAS